MYIFVDESGIFAAPPHPHPQVCCVTTLAISDSGLEKLRAYHAKLLAEWKPSHGELKGRELNESKFHRVFTRLALLDVVPTIVAIDMALEPDSQVTAAKTTQAVLISKSANGPEYTDEFREHVHGLARRVERLSNQSYVQALLQTDAIERTLRVATRHFAQSEPEALSAFVCRIDAKDRAVQECERLWATLINPWLQTAFTFRPFRQVIGPGYDYSAMAPFRNAEMSEPPSHIARMVPNRKPKPYISYDTLVRDVAFIDSKRSEGIQFADIIANAFCRACNGRLERHGWERLSRIMIRNADDNEVVRFATLKPSEVTSDSRRYGDVIRHLQLNARDHRVTRR